MTGILPPLRLVGAQVLRDGRLQRGSVAIEDGLIARGPFREVDLSGYLVLPGIVDMQATSVLAPSTDWRSLDTRFSADAITTACVDIGWGWAQSFTAPGSATTILTQLEDFASGLNCDIRARLTVETHMMDSESHLIEAITSDRLTLIVFANSLGAYERLVAAGPDALRAAGGSDLPFEQMRARVADLLKRGREVPRFLCTLAERLDRCGVAYGSLADPDGETREFHSMLGAKLCFAPASRNAAVLARAVGDPVILTASDVLRPVEAQLGFAAVDAVRKGHCAALASGGKTRDLVAAVRHLIHQEGLDLPQAWPLISTRPAELLRLTDRGTLAQGKRADIAIVHAATGRVEATISAGRLSFVAGGAAQRFLDARGMHAHAAE